MRPYRNESEEAFRLWAMATGWTPEKRGWPDFICRGPDGALMAVEVKSDGDRLSTFQVKTLTDLHRLGLPTFTWTTGAGLRVFPTLPRSDKEPGLSLRIMELEALLSRVVQERDAERELNRQYRNRQALPPKRKHEIHAGEIVHAYTSSADEYLRAKSG